MLFFLINNLTTFFCSNLCHCILIVGLANSLMMYHILTIFTLLVWLLATSKNHYVPLLLLRKLEPELSLFSSFFSYSPTPPFRLHKPSLFLCLLTKIEIFVYFKSFTNSSIFFEIIWNQKIHKPFVCDT